MDIEKVKLLSANQLLDKLKQNGYEQVATILSDRDINGEKLLDLTEFETFRWKLPLSQRKLLFNFINDLKKNPSTTLKADTAIAPKPKYEFSKSTPLTPSRSQAKAPALLTPKPKIGNSPENQDKAAFKLKLGTLFGGQNARPVLPQRPSESSGPNVPFHGIPTPPRSQKADNTQQKGDTPDVSNNRISAPSEPKPPLPPPLEPQPTTRSSSSTISVKRKLPLPEEPARSIQTTTPSRSNVIENGRNRTMGDRSKSPSESQTTLARSTKPSTTKAKLPLPTPVELQIAHHQHALPSPKKLDNAPTVAKQKAPNPEEDYVDMRGKDDLNYGYLTPNDIAISRSGSPFLPPRNTSPISQTRGTENEEEEEEPTYQDPDQVYEPAPSFKNAPNVLSIIDRKPLPGSSRGTNSSKSNTEVKSRPVEVQNREAVEGNKEKQGSGFLKKLFKITGNAYENVEIGSSNAEHRVSVTEKIQPRPLPPLPLESVPPKLKEIPLAEPAGYIELTLHPPEPQEIYANYQPESEDSTYSNTPEIRRSPQSFASPFSTINRRSKNSPDDLAAKLAEDLKTRIFQNKAQSDGSDFEIDPEEDEDFPEQIYSNEERETSEAFVPRSLANIVKSAEEKAPEHLNSSLVPSVNRNLPPENGDDLEGGIYGNVPNPPSNSWVARPLPAPPAQNEIKKVRNPGISYTSLQFPPVSRNVPSEIENNDGQIYGNLGPEHSQPERPQSKRDSIFNISNEPYYRYTDRKGAKQLLRPLKNGAFLFRPSDKHFLVLTTKHNSKFYNFGIERSNAGMIRLTADSRSDTPEFSSLQDFVEYFSKEPLTFQEKTSLAEIYLEPVLPDDAY